jgi:UDP:flavonoid glycosyltransferase YjiC (YdhE family)
MRVLIVALGTMGDVAPYTGLAARLKDGGHEVTIAAYPRFAELVRHAGVEFREIAGDPAVIGRWTQAENGSQAMQSMRETVIEMGEAILDVATLGKAEVLLLSLAALPGVQVAESLGIPSLGVFLEPIYPTAEFPPAFLGVTGSLGPLRNRAANVLVHGVFGLVLNGATNRLRARLGLRTLNRHELREQLAATPVLHGISQSLLPRPADWPQSMEMSGFFWPTVPPDWQPSADLVDFLDAGPPPVFVSFGSRRMSEADAARIDGLVDEALRHNGVRGVIQAGWSGLAGRSERTITIGETSYEWLFPRMAAVVHHCGSGTTAAGLRAGVPTVGIPILGSQPLWAGRVAALGAGPAPIRYKKLSAKRLTDAIAAAVSRPAHREAAQALSRRIAAEDGAGDVLAAVDRLAERAVTDERT